MFKKILHIFFQPFKQSKRGSVFKKILHIFFQPFKQSKGLALIMVLSGTLLVISIIQETIFDTQTEYRSTAAELHALKAYYAAKAGMEISLLRVKNYRDITKTTSGNNAIQSFRPYMDLIWKIPFSWPPVITNEDGEPAPSEEISEITGNSLLQGAAYKTLITSTASRIDLNDLASPIPSLRAWTFKILYQLIQVQQQKLIDDEDTDTQTEILDEAQITEILSNIQDWIDPNELAGEQAVPETNASGNDPSPPNRSLISVTELHQVPGMSDALYEQIKPFVTIHGEKGLNINTAPAELLEALGLPAEAAQEAFAMTSNHALFTKSTFSGFLDSQGLQHLTQELLNDPENSEYLLFDAPHNFTIESTGVFQNSVKTLTAVYVDTAFISDQFNKLIDADIKRQQRNPEREDNPPDNPSPENTPQKPKAAEQTPVIIYWKESS